MSQLVLKHWKFSILLVALLMIVLWVYGFTLAGATVAIIHQATGIYKVKTYGLPPYYRPVYFNLLKERYGITPEVAAGCVVTKHVKQYADGYTSTSEFIFKNRFGHDIFKECDTEALRLFNAKEKMKSKHLEISFEK